MSDRRPLVVILVIAYVLATLYVYVAVMPWHYEEPRRALVTQEMLLTGDYLTPTVYQTPYYRKPPVHNWLLALAAGGDRVLSYREARVPTMLEFMALGLAVFWFLRRHGLDRAYLGFFITITNYFLLCEYSHLAEPDMLLALCTFLSYAIYIRAPERASHLLVSGLLIGVGVLTKGVSPLFFYPGILVHVLLGAQDRGKRLAGLAAHAAAAAVLPLVWAFVFYQRGDLGELVSTSVVEMTGRAEGSLARRLMHVVYYPLRIAVVLLPWPLLAAAAFRRTRVETEDLRTSLLIGALSLALFSLAPGSRDRYIIPAVPFFAVAGAFYIDADRRVPRRVTMPFLLAIATATGIWGVKILNDRYVPQAVALAAAAVGLVILARRHYRVLTLGVVTALAVFTFYMHGLYYQRAIVRPRPRPVAVEIASGVTESIPLVIEDRAELHRVAFHLEAIVGRPVFSRSRFRFGEYYLVTDRRHTDPQGREIRRVPYTYRDVGEVVLQRMGPVPALPPVVPGPHSAGKGAHGDRGSTPAVQDSGAIG